MKIIQKISGIILILCGIISAIPTSDGTAAVLFVPMGVYLTFTREIALKVPDYKHRKKIKKHPFNLAGRKGA